MNDKPNPSVPPAPRRVWANDLLPINHGKHLQHPPASQNHYSQPSESMRNNHPTATATAAAPAAQVRPQATAPVSNEASRPAPQDGGLSRSARRRLRRRRSKEARNGDAGSMHASPVAKPASSRPMHSPSPSAKPSGSHPTGDGRQARPVPSQTRSMKPSGSHASKTAGLHPSPMGEGKGGEVRRGEVRRDEVRRGEVRRTDARKRRDESLQPSAILRNAASQKAAVQGSSRDFRRPARGEAAPEAKPARHGLKEQSQSNLPSQGKGGAGGYGSKW